MPWGTLFTTLLSKLLQVHLAYNNILECLDSLRSNGKSDSIFLSVIKHIF